jgi:hypothetical protein
VAIYSVLLVIHIASGTLGLIAALLSILNKAFNTSHRWHIYTGTAFVIAMTSICITAVAMSLIKLNVFLLLIGVFSFYLAFSGWRYAKNRNGTPTQLDWITVITMLLASAIMLFFGIYLFTTGSGLGVIIIAFGIIGGLLAFYDFRGLQKGGHTGKERIVQHLTMMVGGTIAALTAFIVVNIEMQPSFIPWLAPTVLLTPVIVMWRRTIRKSKGIKGM